MLRITKIIPGKAGQMSVGPCIILGMETKWFKYSYVCTGCDALIEYTMKAGYTPNVTELTCLCGEKTVQVSVVDATIQPINERKEMETTTTAPYSYDANALVTYKVINNGEVSYPTLKVNELEIHLDSYRNLQDQLRISNGQIGKIIDNLNTQGWYNPNVDKEDVLRDICEILAYEPKQTIRITGNMSFEVEYDIPMEDVEDFDARYFLQDALTLDSYNGDLVVESFDVEDADVNW